MRHHHDDLVPRREGRLHPDDVRTGKPADACRFGHRHHGGPGGKSVAVVSGTTTEPALKSYLSKTLIDAKIVVVSTAKKR